MRLLACSIVEADNCFRSQLVGMLFKKVYRIKYIVNAKCFFCNNSDLVQPENVQKMKLFWRKEMLLAANLHYDFLSDDEKLIHNLHDDAVQKGHFTYYDPKTNERILTRLRHFLRGKCCGNACRHCVYNHNNVMDEKKLTVRRFNSSFWTYPEGTETEFDESCYFDGSNLRVRRNGHISRTSFNFNKG